MRITLAQQHAAIEALGLEWDSDIVEIHMTVTTVQVIRQAKVDGHSRVDDNNRLCLVSEVISVG